MSRIAAGFTGGFLVKRRKPEVRVLVVNGSLTGTTTIIRIHPQPIAFGEAIVGLRMWVDNSAPIAAANFTFRVGLVDDLCIDNWDNDVREHVLRARGLLTFGPLAAGPEGLVKGYDLRYLLKIATRRVAWELHNATGGSISYECVTQVEFIPEIGGIVDE
ncbi:MAG: hypothetical protein IID32_05485 [Planctomycetes bacterium]|nr:hypothetical protein [Planctomycetota bacterium]